MNTESLITDIPTLGKPPCPRPFKKEPTVWAALVLFQIKAGLSLK